MIPLPQKKWRILNQNPPDSIIDLLLSNRNLPPDHFKSFRLSERMYDPYLLPDMQKGVERILQAIRRGEKIVIFGDYDVDGITATVLLVCFFRQIRYPVQYIIPHREKDGYGLRPSGVDQAIALGAELIITVDNGISSGPAIDHARKLNLDVVITDHHLQDGKLPAAVAVINPNRLDSQYPFKTICGVTVAFKLAYALSRELMQEADYQQFLLDQLDLVTIGTIADVMPVRDENYALIKFGLRVITRSKKPGIIALKKVAGIGAKEVTPVAIGFSMAPRLNAAGRLDSAMQAVELLLAGNDEEATRLAGELDTLNRERQKLQGIYIDDVLDKLPKNSEAMDKALIVENDFWQPGIIGLISGRLKEQFSRPVIAFTKDEQGNYVGSARSTDVFHVTNALSLFQEHFLSFGGHHKAAGLTVKGSEFESFRQKFIAYANEQIMDEDLIAVLDIDSALNTWQVSADNAKFIREIGPYGESNPEPVFLLKDLLIKQIIQLTEGKHLRLILEKDNQNFEAVWWNSNSFKDIIRFNQRINLVFRMDINSWKGSEKLQLVVDDMEIIS